MPQLKTQQALTDTAEALLARGFTSVSHPINRLEENMKHPTIPCPEHLLPTMRETLSLYRMLKCHADFMTIFICLRIQDAEPDKKLANEARAFINLALEGHLSLCGWLHENDEAYEDNFRYVNEARLDWLEWLTKDAV